MAAHFPGKIGDMRDRIRQAANWLAKHEMWVVLSLSPWVLFPTVVRPLTMVSLVCLPLLWLVRRLAGRPLATRTPLDGPMLLMLFSVGTAVLVSPLPEQSVRQATTFLLGISLFFAIMNGSDRWRRPELIGGLLTAAGLVFALWALVATDWGSAKVAWLGRLTDRLPQLADGAPGSAFWQEVRAGEVGGLMASLLPVVTSFALLSWRRGRQPLMDRWHALAWASTAGGLLMGILLVLCQSRTSILALLLVSGVVAAVRWRPLRVITLALILAAVLLLSIGLLSGNLGDWLTAVDAATRSAGTEPHSWTQRVETWHNALLMMRDYPIVGAGLGAYEGVAWLNYGFDTVAPGDSPQSANNLWLQAGAELGLVGFVGFAWLTVVVVLFGWAVQRRRMGEERVQLTGMWLGLVVWLVHGMANAFPLGARPALITWVMVAGLMAAWRRDGDAPKGMQPEVARRRRRSGRPWLIVGLLVTVVTGALVGQSGPWSLNRGANLLDGALLSGAVAADGASQGQLAQASALITAAAELPGALRRRALIAYTSGDEPQAVILFRQDSGGEQYLVSRSRQLLAHGELVESEEFVRMALQAVPESGRLACLMGDVYRLTDRFYDAISFYREVPEMAASFGDRDRRLAECMYQLATAEKQLGNWGAAATNFGIAAQLSPDEADYQIEYGWAVFRSVGDINQAAAMIESVLVSSPDDVHVMIELADLFLQGERPQRSLEWSETAVETSPTEPEAWLRLAQAYWALEQGDDARAAIAEVLRLNPANEVAQALQAEWESQ